MPWQEPSNNQSDNDSDNNQQPRRPQNQQEELDQMAKELQEKLGRFFGGGGNNGNGAASAGLPSLIFLIGLMSLIWLATGLYMVDDAEQGVVQRFGKYVKTTEPGLRWRFPAPIDTVTEVNTKVIRTATFDKTMLTQDENIVDVDLNVQYLVSDPAKYLFNVRVPRQTVINVKAADETLKEVSRSAIREVVGKNNLDYIITEGREDVAAKTIIRIQETLDSYDMGIKVTAVNLRDANFPLEVNDAVQDAIRAREDKETAIFEAQTYANDIVPKARGEAAKRLEDAAAYKAQEIADAEGEASRFDQLRVEYEKAPEVTRKRLYLETVEEVYGNSSKVIMDSKDSGNLIYLPVDQLIKQGGSSSNNTSVTSPRQTVTPNKAPTAPKINPRDRSTNRGVR